MVTEPPIKMGIPDWIPLIVIPVLYSEWCTCNVPNNGNNEWYECAHVPLHSGGLLQVAFA